MIELLFVVASLICVSGGNVVSSHGFVVGFLCHSSLATILLREREREREREMSVFFVSFLWCCGLVCSP